MSKANLLGVEASDDKGAVIGLMQHFVEWGSTKEEWPVYIQMAKSADELLDAVYLGTAIKSSGLRTLGVVVDADDKFKSRWGTIHRFAKVHFKDVPKEMPKEGLILENDEKIRFGAWIMPDNASDGMLETFCKTLVPDKEQKLWKHAEGSFHKAKEAGSPVRNAHHDRAIIHTWLAWQDPPGERIGIALTSKILDPGSASAKLFVSWFIKLFELAPKQKGL